MHADGRNIVLSVSPSIDYLVSAGAHHGHPNRSKRLPATGTAQRQFSAQLPPQRNLHEIARLLRQPR